MSNMRDEIIRKKQLFLREIQDDVDVVVSCEAKSKKNRKFENS